MGDMDITTMQSEDSGTVSSSSLDLKKYAAKWILKTSETRNLTRQATIDIIEDTSFLCLPSLRTYILKNKDLSVIKKQPLQK